MSVITKKAHHQHARNRLWILLAGVMVIMAAIILAAALRPAPPASQMAVANPLPALPLEVSVKEAAQLREQGAFMLDVRQPEEWEAGHIPGAVLIPLAELPKRLNEVPADQTVVVVCRSGNRSAQAVQTLRQAGFSQTTSMAAGMNQWTAAGYETVSGP
jgi:rhodanese-related sulfurtransferase